MAQIIRENFCDRQRTEKVQGVFETTSYITAINLASLNFFYSDAFMFMFIFRLGNRYWFSIFMLIENFLLKITLSKSKVG